jgi:NTE family protein
MDWTIPIVSFFAGRKLSGALEEMFGDARIEDLPAPFFCTSANLTRAQIVVHERGPLGRAIQASCAVPGFYPPVLEGGDMLVDGGILSTVPHEAMREFCDGGRVIAVNVMAEVDLQNAAGLEGFSAARYLWQRWRPFARTRPAVPGLLSIMYRAAELGSVRARANAVDQPDLLLEPPITHLSSVDGTPFDQFVEAGYRHTREMLARWEGGPKL